MKKVVLNSFILASFFLPTISWAQTEPSASTHVSTKILGMIEQLESKRDPKCYATASRLENMIYGIPLSEQARFKEFEFQKALVRWILSNITSVSLAGENKVVRINDVQASIAKMINYTQTPEGQITVHLPSGEQRRISAVRFDQYSSIAYALRAILSIEQEEMVLNKEEEWVSLDQEGIALLKQAVDVYTVISLELASLHVRQANGRFITPDILADAWREMCRLKEGFPFHLTQVSGKMADGGESSNLMNNIINEKLKAYHNYNKFEDAQAGPLFLKMISNNYAKVSIVEDPKEQDNILAGMDQHMGQFVKDVLKRAEQSARKQNKAFILAPDVYWAGQEQLPHFVDDREAVTFFPKLTADKKIFIANYDCDSFRDFAAHWKVMKKVFEDASFSLSRNLDPFAAEIVAEHVAQYGALLLRIAGILAQAEANLSGKPALLTKALIDHSAATIKQWTQESAKAVPPEPIKEQIISAPGVYGEFSKFKKLFFNDVTWGSGINFTHRLSPWYTRWLNEPDEKGNERIVINNAGVAADDINNDGYPDILLLSGGGNKLYINDRRGSFKDRTKEAGINLKHADGQWAEPRQAIIADLDNDGFQDIVITYVHDKHRVFRNKDGIHFEDVSDKANLGGENKVAGPVMVFDYDGDGLLDIYVGYYGSTLLPGRRSNFAAYMESKERGVRPTLDLDNRNAGPNALFRNLGRFQFADVTKGSGTENRGWTTALSHTDLNADGLQDIIISNDYGRNNILYNLGEGRFKDVTASLGITRAYHSMNVGLADLNRDGFADIYFSNINSMLKNARYAFPGADTVIDAAPGNIAKMIYNETNTLYLSHLEKGHLASFVLNDQFNKGTDDLGWSWNATFLDFDNDGDDDLYVLNGYNDYAQRKNLKLSNNDLVMSVRLKFEPDLDQNRDYNIFFVNQNGQFDNFSDGSGVKLKGYSSSAAYLDADRDGDADMVINNNNLPAGLFRNNSNVNFPDNHWMQVKLVGDPKVHANRDAIGARLVLVTPKGNRIWREIRGGEGYLTMNPKEQYFGLGAETQGDLHIFWPNGQEQVIKALTSQRYYRISQATGEVEIIKF